MMNRPDAPIPFVSVMTSRDARQIFDVCAAAGDEHPSLPEGILRAEDLDELMGSGVAFFVAFVEGEAVGALGYRWEARTLRVVHLAVKSAHQRCGVGRRLMQAVESVGSALGTRSISLEIGVDVEALTAFEAFGYAPTPQAAPAAAESIELRKALS